MNKPNAFLPFRKDHEIRFKQDCLSVAVDYDETEDFHGWNSTVATILVEEKGRVGLRYAYEVTYRDGQDRDPLLPRQSKGFEELFVVNSTEGEQPTRLTGFFAHTVEDPAPRYSGTVEFVRKPTKPNIFWGNNLTKFIIKKWLKPPAG